MTCTLGYMAPRLRPISVLRTEYSVQPLDYYPVQTTTRHPTIRSHCESSSDCFHHCDTLCRDSASPARFRDLSPLALDNKISCLALSTCRRPEPANMAFAAVV